AMQIHVGLFADTMPPALESRSIAALYCDGIMYQSSWDCLASAGPRVQSGGWVYQDDFYAFSGNYQAVTDWIASSAKKHMRMQLVPEEGDFRTIKDLKGCKPPPNNDGRVSGTCENELTPVEACFWMVYYRKIELCLFELILQQLRLFVPLHRWECPVRCDGFAVMKNSLDVQFSWSKPAQNPGSLKSEETRLESFRAGQLVSWPALSCSKVPCNIVSVSIISKGKQEHGKGTNLKHLNGRTEQETSSEAGPMSQ
ncbi:hypothetical protein THAOC_21050, partial [Thalassiosira oceanica]